MNALQVFTNPEFGTVRTLLIDSEPWAVGKDIATALGYDDPAQAVRKHVDTEDRIMGRRNDTPPVTDNKGRTQYPTWINESGLYSLILSSKLPSAKRFKRWVTSEVLPALRKTGSYTVPEAAPRVLTPDDYLTAARILSGCRNERLPYVIPLIQKAGIEVAIDAKAVLPHVGKDPQTAKLLDTAITDYGLSIRQVEKLTGIHSAQLYRMRRGTTRYNAARAAIIRDVVHALIPELDIDEITSDFE